MFTARGKRPQIGHS